MIYVEQSLEDIHWNIYCGTQRGRYIFKFIIWNKRRKIMPKLHSMEQREGNKV